MNDGWNAEALTSDIGAVDDSQPQQLQEPKINKKKFSELVPNGKKLQIYTRDPKTRALLPCTALGDIPADVAAICSDALYKKIVVQKDPVLIINDDLGLAAYKFVFDWIKTCGEEQNVANIPEIKELIVKETGMAPFIQVMLVAQKLRIPEASFNKFMVRKLMPLAKEYLVPLEMVSRAYDQGDTDFDNLNLREVCVQSVFSHWYDYKLETEEDWDYMCDLADMRDNIPELDKDLQKAVTAKDQWLKERKAQKQAQDKCDTGVDDSNNQDQGGSEWPAQDAVSSGIVGDWQKEGLDTTGGGNWPNQAAVGVQPSDGSGGNWADTMNEDANGQSDKNVNPVAMAPSSW